MITQKTNEKPAGFCNTPQNSQGLWDGADLTVGIDYLTLVYRYPTYDQFFRSTEFLLDYVGDPLVGDFLGTRVHGRSFQNHGKTMFGAEVLFNTLEDGSVDCMYALSGGTLSHSKPRDLARALMYLDKWFISCNRIDIMVDGDSHRMGELREKILYSKLSGLHSGFHTMREIIAYDRHNDNEHTLYLGSRKSVGTFVRIYDKVVRDGKTRQVKDRFIRFEAECKGGRANAIFRQYMDSIYTACVNDTYNFSAIYTALFSTAISRIHFYQGKKDKNLARNQLALWWLEFLNAINYNPIQLKPVSKDSSLQKTLDWLVRSVAPSLEMVRRCLGTAYPQYISDLYNIGKDRMSELQRKLIEWHLYGGGSDYQNCAV